MREEGWGKRGREGGDSRKEGRPLDISMLKAVIQTYMLNFTSELLLTQLHMDWSAQ